MPDSDLVSKRLNDLRRAIDAHMKHYLATLPAGIGVGVSQNGELVIDRLKEFSLRPGKRIRGSLAMIGYEMFGGTNKQTALDLAIVVELVQNYLLIVDDVMDRSAQRRGGDTIHMQYQKILQQDFSSADYRHLGDMLGINVGLITQHLAAMLLNQIGEAPERVVRAQQLFQANIAATGFGQIDDLMNEAGQALDLEGTRHMYMLKSSYYTFINPLQLGAVLAGADEAELPRIKEFGQLAGVAFQLQDDIIGMFGDAETTGKSHMDDLREGKMTFLMRHALSHADQKQLATIKAAMGNTNVTVEQHTAVKSVLEALGSRRYVEQEARRAAKAADEIVQAADWPQEAKTFLHDLLEFIISRKH